MYVDFKINKSVVWTKKNLKNYFKIRILAAKFRLDRSLFSKRATGKPRFNERFGSQKVPFVV